MELKIIQFLVSDLHFVISCGSNEYGQNNLLTKYHHRILIPPYILRICGLFPSG